MKETSQRHTFMRIFVTHIVPREEVLKYCMSIAACNFSHNLIEGGVFDEVYSVLPSFVRRLETSFQGLVCSWLRRMPVFYRLAPLLENVQLFARIPRRASVWYYNCTILNAALIILLKFFKPNVRQYMIILDYTPSRKLSQRFFLWLSNRMDGIVKLADSPLFTVRNSVTLPGVVPVNSPSYPRIEEVRKEFLISGALGDNIAMLPVLLEVFAQLSEFTLHITGQAPDLDLVERYTSKYNNIVYHGMVEYDEYLEILHAVPFLLSTRNPQYPENLCNFPSKIIEALLHNRIVVSTLHYPQLDGIEYLEIAAERDGMIRDLRRIASMEPNKLLLGANQADKVKKRFSCHVWKQWMETIEQRTS